MYKVRVHVCNCNLYVCMSVLKINEKNSIKRRNRLNENYKQI